MTNRRVMRVVPIACLATFVPGTMVLAAGRGSYPSREAFVASNPTSEQVPIEAFQFDSSADDLKIEVWATSPQLFSPVAMDIDPQGRVWAVEGVDYGQSRSLGDGTSIVVLTDSNDDGRADRSHVFVAERNIRAAPLGIAVFDNQIVLSATPSIILYTDVNRDARFDPKIDKREVFLTGFVGGGHDHTLHAVIPSPSGQWYFSYGNKGANIRTRDGRHFISGSYYGNSEDIGKTSSDGHLYVGGAAMRINPDGTGLAVVGHNLRNTHDMVVSSFGDVFHNDNDDPTHCRATWLMEYGNLGYADLIDGSKSWEEVAKPWEERRVPDAYRKIRGGGDLRISSSHWRENYPGSLPPGDVYGAGSPTGVTLIEGDELGRAHRGTYLACDMVRKAVLGYKPTAIDAQIEMRGGQDFLGLKASSRSEFFLPTDVAVGPEGAVYLSDFYNNTSRRVNQKSGTIYRITRRQGDPPRRPKINFATIPGLFTALANPNPGVRWVALTQLRSRGDEAIPDAQRFYRAHAGNPYVQARAIWLLAQLGGEGLSFVENLLSDDHAQIRLVAYRALRFATPRKLLARAATLARDKSAAVRREVALSLRNVPFGDCRELLGALIDGYDGTNRWYLEALGTASAQKETQVYDELVRPRTKTIDYRKWNDVPKNLAWRLHTDAAVTDLDRVIRDQKPDIHEFRHLIMAFTVFRDEPSRRLRKKIVLNLAAVPAFAGEDYQLTIDQVYRRDIRLMPLTHLNRDYRIPTAFGRPTNVSSPAVIAKLPGDAQRGGEKAALCLTCHRIGDAGVAFGPNLGAWGGPRTIEEIVREIVDPADKLAHGYEKPVRLTARGGKVAEGQMTNYAHHAGSLKIKVFGGQVLKIPFRRDGVKIQHLGNHSWMPPASKMGLSDQDVRDIAEYLKTR